MSEKKGRNCEKKIGVSSSRLVASVWGPLDGYDVNISDISFHFLRLLETVAYLEGGYLSSRLLDPVSLSVKRLKTLLDQRGVSYAGVVEKKELTDLVDGSGMFDTCNCY